MLNLAGRLSSAVVQSINEIVREQFKDPKQFKTAEALCIFERQYMDEEELYNLCQEQYDEPLTTPTISIVSPSILSVFENTRAVPVSFDFVNKEVTCVYLPELQYDILMVELPYSIKYEPTTIYHYVRAYTQKYGLPDFLLPISGKSVLDSILEVAIDKGATDLTITSIENGVTVYYNINKQKVSTNQMFPKYIMEEIIRVLTIENAMADTQENLAHYVGYQIDDTYRARVVINRNIHGFVCTIRLFSTEVFDMDLESLNINGDVIKHVRDTKTNHLNGLRVITGETMSGKNTTCLGMLREVLDEGTSKVVSIEFPVEQIISGVEQISVDSTKQYQSNIESLIHQNPDFVYIAEMRDDTAKMVMAITNTGKRVLTTLHANSVADTISRIVDCTGLSVNRIIQTLHTIYHQDLVNIKGHLYPRTTYVYFDDAFKQELYDKPFGEVIRLIKEREGGGFNESAIPER